MVDGRLARIKGQGKWFIIFYFIVMLLEDNMYDFVSILSILSILSLISFLFLSFCVLLNYMWHCLRAFVDIADDLEEEIKDIVVRRMIPACL